MHLFQSGLFTLSSGISSAYKLDCDALSEEDIATLAKMIREMVGPFCHCIGIPRGGMRLQQYLSPMATEGPILIVDDVFTTGASMDREWGRMDSAFPKLAATNGILGAVIFARGKCPSWIKPLFTLDECFWPKT